MFVIPVITGATATGKSRLVYELMDVCDDLELVSADAFQVYKRFNIGTAKPSLELLKRFRHHLVDIIEPDGSFSAGDFVERAETAVADILSRGKKPVIVGGTGLYIRLLRDGIFDSPYVDEVLKKELRARLEAEGSEKLHEELSAIDPRTAAKIHLHDWVRILRALEVWHTLGIPISQARQMRKTPPVYQYKVMVLEKERPALYRDIDVRVAKMIGAGWLEEVRGLLDDHYTPCLPSFRAIGYTELAEVLSGGKKLDAAVETIARKTRNFAKRQLTWFKGMENVSHMPAEDIKKALKMMIRG